MTITFRHKISGYLVGQIWQPCGECYKPLDYDLTREERLFLHPGTLRDHVLRATNDGDFQGCEIADGYLETEITIIKGARHYRRTRLFPLEAFPSIKDCVKTDWDGPSCAD